MKRPRLYFSLRSPFSWMAVRQLEERVPQARQLIEYVPFTEPDPTSLAALHARGGEFHYVPMSKAKHLYILNDTKRLSAKFGYQMKWPIDVDPVWWDLPHLAWLKARETGDEHIFYNAVMAARWERGENICDREGLRRICCDAGLEGDHLVAAPEDPHIREQGVDALMQVYLDDVFGVPYFKVGRQRFWGLDRLDDFIATFDKARAAEGSSRREGVMAK